MHNSDAGMPSAVVSNQNQTTHAEGRLWRLAHQRDFGFRLPTQPPAEWLHLHGWSNVDHDFVVHRSGLILSRFLLGLAKLELNSGLFVLYWDASGLRIGSGTLEEGARRTASSLRKLGDTGELRTCADRLRSGLAIPRTGVTSLQLYLLNVVNRRDLRPLHIGIRGCN